MGFGQPGFGQPGFFQGDVATPSPPSPEFWPVLGTRLVPTTGTRPTAVEGAALGLGGSTMAPVTGERVPPTPGRVLPPVRERGR